MRSTSLILYISAVVTVVLRLHASYHVCTYGTSTMNAMPNQSIAVHIMSLGVQVDYAESVELSLQQLQQHNTSNDDWDVLRGIADELGVSDGTNKSAARRQFLDTFGVKQVSLSVGFAYVHFHYAVCTTQHLAVTVVDHCIDAI
jgi:hypothetical protein